MTNKIPKIENKNWQNQIVQSINEGICVVTKENLISFANPAAARILGWKIDDLVGQRYEVLFDIEPKFDQTEAEAIICPIQFALIEGEVTHVNTETFYRQNGTSLWVEYICIPLRENDEIAAAVVTFEDISERRDLEDAVANARDAALEAARIKANFLANMSHEIRTPLNGIVGITELLALTSLSTEQTKYIETLKTSGNLLLGIVNDILDFSKIEANRLELEMIDFDLAQVINETIQLFEPEASKQQVRLKSEVEKSIITTVTGDVGRLRQVLNNLVSNAIKFTRDGEVCLKIIPQTDNLLRFEITDTGLGIEKDKQAKIFEPFTQADISTTRQFGGTGLGLAISKQLVQMMGGKIGLESELGQGTTFWFTTKFEIQSLPQIEPIVPLKNETQPSLTFLSHLKPQILVVEDNHVNQEIAIGRLRQLGIEADIAQNGLVALESLKNKKYDLILMDCRMPEMDGFEATRQIRQLQNEAKNIKIIAMTASVTHAERERCFQAGMDDYLAKPMTIEVLAEMLSQHLRDKISSNRLDVEENIVQHPFAQILEATILQSFVEIEARGEKGFIKEVLGIYLSHSELELSQLKNAFESKNLNLVKNKAHSLKGSSGNIGLTDLFQHFTKFEQLVENNWVEAEQTLNKILEKFIELKTKVSHLTEFGD